MMESLAEQWAELPGADVVLAGIADANAGLETANALLVAIAAPRLAALGVPVPDRCRNRVDAELALYAALGRADIADPYSMYNALLRELVSFTRALEHRTARRRRLL
jgi:hypothetical protein